MKGKKIHSIFNGLLKPHPCPTSCKLLNEVDPP
uniref:Uncharacterized protein n=1 Tax=Anguilla anguilla TaxID=7936 RepID=A0A0E9SI71_ANGAN